MVYFHTAKPVWPRGLQNEKNVTVGLYAAVRPEGGVLTLRVACIGGPVTVTDLRLVESVCPYPITAIYSDPDEKRQAIFHAACESFRQNAVDVFMDCPTRERAGWHEYWIGNCSATVHWGWKGEETIPGDINGDTVLSIMDVTNLLQALAKQTAGTAFLPIYDVNSDTNFSIMDVTKLLQMLAKAA